MDKDTKSIIFLALFAVVMLVIGYTQATNFTQNDWNNFALITLIGGLIGGAFCFKYLGQSYARQFSTSVKHND